MDDFAKGKPAEWQPYFEETTARQNSTTTAVERDFFRISATNWVTFDINTVDFGV